MEVCKNLELEDLTIGGEVEQWKQVCEIEGLENVRDIYYVSNFGRIKSISGKFGDRVMKQNKGGHGYLQIDLQTVDGKRKGMLVNRLVAFAFVEGYSEECNQANHINEIKYDNRASNLNWMTAKQNINHGTRTERTSKAVIGTCVDTGVTISFPSTAEAGRNGFDYSSVAKACRGERKTHKGFRWKYAS